MSKRLSPEQYQKVCLAVLTRDGWKCRNCGFRQTLHVHHVRYRSHGGEDDVPNLITICAECHDAIHKGILIIYQEDPPINTNYEVEFRRIK